MTCDSDKSDASTSDSGGEFELEQHEYERKRELYLSKIIFCERKFQEIKPALLRLRLNQIETLQDSILNHKSEFYLTRKAVLDNEFDAKRNHIKILRKLRMEALQRRSDGDRHNAEMTMKNNKALVKEAIRESIQKKYEKLRIEQQEVERLTGLTFGASGEEDFESLVLNDADERQLAPVKVIEKYISKKDELGRLLWSDIPVLISQLPKHDIEEDLQLLNSTESVKKQ